MWAVTCKHGKILKSWEVFHYYVWIFYWRGNLNFRKCFQLSSSVGYFSLNKSDYKLVVTFPSLNLLELASQWTALAAYMAWFALVSVLYKIINGPSRNAPCNLYALRGICSPSSRSSQLLLQKLTSSSKSWMNEWKQRDHPNNDHNCTRQQLYFAEIQAPFSSRQG